MKKCVSIILLILMLFSVDACAENREPYFTERPPEGIFGIWQNTDITLILLNNRHAIYIENGIEACGTYDTDGDVIFIDIDPPAWKYNIRWKYALDHQHLVLIADNAVMVFDAMEDK